MGHGLRALWEWTKSNFFHSIFLHTYFLVLTQIPPNDPARSKIMARNNFSAIKYNYKSISIPTLASFIRPVQDVFGDGLSYIKSSFGLPPLK